ncbi:MAG: hypothetical protein ACK59M_17850 [Pseudomonadota bacterium]|jgi:hypothetical protein
MEMINGKLRHAALAGAIVLATGCASVQTAQPKYQTGSFPEAGARTKVSVGQVMVSKYDYLSQGGATLRSAVESSFWTGRSGLTAGSQLVSAISSGEEVYCQPPARLGAPCLKDENNDGRFDRAYTMNAYGFLVNGVDIPPAEYRTGDKRIEDGFKYELIYQGVDNGVVRIAYREFTENLARPAFSQELTYTLDGDSETKFRFREVSATIHAADNNEIDYTVDSGF